jgi:hypothetical protein
MIDKREADETTVAACEGDRCKPTAKCMLSDCIAPTPCKVSGACLAREIYTISPEEKAHAEGLKSDLLDILAWLPTFTK